MQFFFCTILLVLFSGCQSTPKADSASEPKVNTKQTAENEPSSVSLERMDVEFLYLASQNALSQGQPTLAIQFLQAILQKDELAFTPRLELANLLLSTNHVLEARHVIEAMPASVQDSLAGEDLAEYQMLYAQILITNNALAQAAEMLQAFIDVNPDFVKARLLLVRLEVSREQFVRAHALLHDGIKRHEHLQLRQYQVQLYMEQGNYKQADQVLAKMQQLFPNEENVVLQRSELAAQRGEDLKAYELLRIFISGHADSANQSYALLADLYMRKQRYDDAIKTYNEMLLLTADSAEVHLSLGRLYYQRGDYALAKSSFEQAVSILAPSQNENEMSNELASAYFYLGASLEAAHHWQEAIPYYEKLAPNHDSYLDAQIRLASVDLTLKNTNKVEKRLAELKKGYPDNLEIAELYVALRMQQKEYQLLIDESEPALDLGFSAMLMFNRAIAYESLKQFESLDQTLDKLLSQKPDHSEALNFYGYSLADRGIRLSDAEKMIQRALQIKPDDGYYLDSLAWVYFQNKQYGLAVKTQLLAVQNVIDDPVMYEHLGDMYWKAGDQDKAKLNWNKALQLGHEEKDVIKKKIEVGLP